MSGLISIVVPVYNEADGIREFDRRLAEVRGKLQERSEVVYVNDGSCDDTLGTLQSLRERDPPISTINLSRNFGKEIALTAGLDHSRGDTVIHFAKDPTRIVVAEHHDQSTAHDLKPSAAARAARWYGSI